MHGPQRIFSRGHYSLIMGCPIINLVSSVREVALGFRSPPLRLAMWAQEPPKSSSRYVQHKDGLLPDEQISKKRCSFGFTCQNLCVVAASRATS